VIDHPEALSVVGVPVPPVVVKPKTKKQEEACPQIEQEKDIHIQPDHRRSD